MESRSRDARGIVSCYVARGPEYLAEMNYVPCDGIFNLGERQLLIFASGKKTGGRVNGRPGGVFPRGNAGRDANVKWETGMGKLAGAHKDGRPKAPVRFGGETELGEGQIGLFHRRVRTCMCPIRKKNKQTLYPPTHVHTHWVMIDHLSGSMHPFFLSSL